MSRALISPFLQIAKRTSSLFYFFWNETEMISESNLIFMQNLPLMQKKFYDPLDDQFLMILNFLNRFLHWVTQYSFVFISDQFS